MSIELPTEKKFKVLVEITRASHFAWREAISSLTDVDPTTVVLEMWRITGIKTAEAYLSRLDPAADLARQLADSIVWSSLSMGEDAEAETGDTAGEYLVRHHSCPWHRWHQRHDLLAEDRPGCDQWFAAMIETVNDRLGCRLHFETVSALPDGDPCCLRRLWRADQPGHQGLAQE